MVKTLGASLYVPATHKYLMDVASGTRLGNVRSLIMCTEDAVADRELSYALFNLSLVLANMPVASQAERFVRVRNLDVMARVLAMPGADKLTGFVIPKATQYNLPMYLNLVRDTAHMLMPTLETAEVFYDAEMHALRHLISSPGIRERVVALRIGGNDLLALLGLRRPRNMTIYRTPLGPVIGRLVTTFRPHGFALTAPVFEHLDLPHLLDEEVNEDLAHGMVGKTAIHPSQIDPIESHYRVSASDLEEASAILRPDSPAVFAMNQSMCEVATHRAWAESTLERSRLFGSHPRQGQGQGQESMQSATSPVLTSQTILR
jgi:citrate lyase beta subunit